MLVHGIRQISLGPGSPEFQFLKDAMELSPRLVDLMSRWISARESAFTNTSSVLLFFLLSRVVQQFV